MKTVWRFVIVSLLAMLPGLAAGESDNDADAWTRFVGVAGPSGWRAHVIQPDPLDHGPDGFNPYDWDGDGDLDVFVNFEEGGYSRLYFNPGADKVRELWRDFIEMEPHGQCEDSGIGDLDGDGDIDYIANGGHVFFNPGQAQVRDASQWEHMILFTEEARDPTVSDIDGDGLNDLIVGAEAWYKQPVTHKHDAAHWTRYELGEADWPMTTIVHDIDGDGDNDIVVQERRKQGTFYYENLGGQHLTQPWPIRMIDAEIDGMFMVLGDVNGDGRLDLVKASKTGLVCLYLRTNDRGPPDYHRVKVPQPVQPAGLTPKGMNAKSKGVGLIELNGDPTLPEIVVMPEYEAQFWYLTMTGDGVSPEDWTTTLMDLPGPETRKKMDNVYLADLDGDGDLDMATTEENGGWGIVWFENPTTSR